MATKLTLFDAHDLPVATANQVRRPNRVEIVVGDARKALEAVPDEHFQCVVTSPPYWGLRSLCFPSSFLFRCGSALCLDPLQHANPEFLGALVH